MLRVRGERGMARGVLMMPAPDFAAASEWDLVETYGATGPDGHDALVMEIRMPARFYRVVSADADIDLTTGSGEAMWRLAQSIARAIAAGMLGNAEGGPLEQAEAAIARLDPAQNDRYWGARKEASE